MYPSPQVIFCALIGLSVLAFRKSDLRAGNE